MPAMSPQRTQILGLDAVRATAILLVMAAHYANNIGVWLGLSASPYVFIAGDVGVDIFFVLSGFLIGGLLLELIERAPTLENLWVFLVRRWLRTVPLYLLWLCVLVWMFRRTCRAS